jgi:hypothetical protein
MTTTGSALGQPTGTTSFNPSLGEAVLYAFARCGVFRTEITTEHLQNARIAANMIMSDWSNDQPNLWTVSLQSVQCVAGQTTYDLPASTVLILDAYLRLNTGQPGQADFVMWPISRSEYSAFPNKTTPGFPTVFWFDRLLAPTVTLWQPPANASWVFWYYCVNQIQDAALANGATLDVPFYFLKAYSDRLAAELAVIYAPERAVPLGALADKSYLKATERNAESVPLFIMPGLNSYFRVR